MKELIDNFSNWQEVIDHKWKVVIGCPKAQTTNPLNGILRRM